MLFTTTIEKRADNRIFAGNDPAHTANGSQAV
ncbi:Head decoration protein [Salmonella enterica subsp. enterica]|uniref:Head decoration protein n=1 Tax=Salmonella enterica I TaxID=59201 RepID=A0A379V2N9_SALET|nr:Head decoration protein [Salmonella enterica subsp. enterica]